MSRWAVAPDVRWVAVGGAPLLNFLIALTGAMIARAALQHSRGSRCPPEMPTSWGDCPSPQTPPGEGLAAPPGLPKAE